jgi:tetratricopeptide (TPR) repeat protein
LCSELIYHSTLERRLALADEAKSIARRLGDRATFVDVVCRCGTALLAPSTLATQLLDAAEALAAAQELDDPVGLLRSANIGFALAVRAGQFELADERLAIQREMAEKLGQPSFLWMANYGDASAALLHGDIEKAEQLVAAALEVGTASGQPDAFAFYSVQLMNTRYLQGRMGELVALIADTVEQNPSIPTFKAVLAKAYLDSGNEVAARDLIDEAAANASFSLPQDNAWFDGMANYARVVTELQLHAHGERLIELLVEFRDQVPHNGLSPQLPVATNLGGLATLIGHYEEAESYFEQAAELNIRGAMWIAEAETNLLWGRMFRVRNGSGDTDRARRLLEQARECAAARGYAIVERQANAELSKLS